MEVMKTAIVVADHKKEQTFYKAVYDKSQRYVWQIVTFHTVNQPRGFQMWTHL